VVVREFVIREGCEKDFELVFAPDGVWPELLQSYSEGFAGTALEKLSSVANGYKVRDYWRSHRDFEEFRGQHRFEIDQFQRWLASKDLVEHETLLGAFYDDGEDESGLVLR